MYRRNVHCRYCGESGHNRNGCAKLKEYIKNNPNSWVAEQAMHRAEIAKHRKCSYCSNEGHNRKTCKLIMSDMIKVAGVNQDFRKKFIQNIIKKNGIAPGALITIDNTSGYNNSGAYFYDLKDKMALVTDIVLDEVYLPNRDSGCYIVKIQYMDVYDYGGKRLSETVISVPNWFILGKEPPTNKWQINKLGFKVISPGYYDVDNEDVWVKDKKSVENVCNIFNNHRDLSYAIECLQT